jgi:enterochelin esterase-like enzyme
MPNIDLLLQQGGFVLLFILLLRGDMRTKQELETANKAHDYDRELLNKLLPALEKMTQAVEALTRQFDKSVQ